MLLLSIGQYGFCKTTTVGSDLTEANCGSIKPGAPNIKKKKGVFYDFKKF